MFNGILSPYIETETGPQQAASYSAECANHALQQTSYSFPKDCKFCMFLCSSSAQVMTLCWQIGPHLPLDFFLLGNLTFRGLLDCKSFLLYFSVKPWSMLSAFPGSSGFVLWQHGSVCVGCCHLFISASGLCFLWCSVPTCCAIPPMTAAFSHVSFLLLALLRACDGDNMEALALSLIPECSLEVSLPAFSALNLSSCPSFCC